MVEGQTTPVKTNTEPFSGILKARYKELADDYSKVVQDRGKAEYNLDPETQRKIDRLPTESREKTLAFAASLTSVLPETFDLDLIPTSGIAIRALMAAVYLNEKRQGKPIDDEMYVRAMGALADGAVVFRNDFDSTGEVLEQFVQVGYSKVNFYNFAVNLLGATMPVASWRDVEENYQNYKGFHNGVEREINISKSTLKEKVKKFLGDQSVAHLDGTTSPVYVHDIDRNFPFTNDIQTNEERNYNSNTSAAAITFGRDEITGLDIVLYRVPYNHDYTEEQFSKEHDDKQSNRPARKEASAYLHELVHNLSERDYIGDWKTLFNEMLTDSTAISIQMEAHGGEFGGRNSGDLKPYTGYVVLVNFAEDLVINGVITRDDLVEFGLKQNPDGFLNKLEARIKQDSESAKNVAESLVRRRLIPPAKVSELPEIAEKLKKNPKGFMEKEMMAMWNFVGRGYLAEPMYLLAIKDILAENKEYVDKIKMAFQEQYPNEEFVEIDIVFDPKTKRLFTDEVVDTFRNIYSAEVIEHPYRGYSKLKDLADYVSGDLQNIRFGESLPESMQINGLDNPARTAELIKITNQALGSFYYNSIDKAERPGIVVQFSKDLYNTIGEVLEKNWGRKGIDYDYRDIVRIIRDVLPFWFRYPNKPYPENTEQIIDGVKLGLESLTAEVDIDGEMRFIPVQQQIFHYGPALQVEKQDS